MTALNLNSDNRILSACRVLPNRVYTDMPIVETVPEGNIVDYQYINNEFVYNPLPKEDEVEEEQKQTIEDRVTELETAFSLLLEGATE